MLNPCSTQVWFIVELCDLAQVKSIQIANFELFSSTPESFRVYVSKRYPTREWLCQGHFKLARKGRYKLFHQMNQSMPSTLRYESVNSLLSSRPKPKLVVRPQLFKKWILITSSTRYVTIYWITRLVSLILIHGGQCYPSFEQLWPEGLLCLATF